MKRNKFFVQAARRAAGVLAAVLTFGLVFAGCSGKENAQSGGGGNGAAKIKTVKAGGIAFVELPYGDDGEIAYVPKSIYDVCAEFVGLEISYINRGKVLTQKEVNEYQKTADSLAEALDEIDSDKTEAALEKLFDTNTVAENQKIAYRMVLAIDSLTRYIQFFGDFVPVSVPLEGKFSRVILAGTHQSFFKDLNKYFPTLKFDYTRTIDYMLENANTPEAVNDITKIVSITSVQLNKEQQAQYDTMVEKLRPVFEALENGFETKPGEDGSGMVIVKYTGPGGNIVIPEGTVRIDDKVFSENRNLTSVKIPDSVTSIGDSAFGDCVNLTSISMGNGVTTIGRFVFYGCENLVSVNIPDGVASIGEYAFMYCKSLTSINIPDGVTSIGDSTFDGCTNLTSVKIPDSVTSIGDSTFDGCENLVSVEIPDGVTTIGSSAFSGCTNLTSVKIPDSVTSISNYAFSGCGKLDAASSARIIAVNKWAFGI